MREVVKTGLILFIFTLAAGLILGLVYSITSPQIANAELNFKLSSIKEVMTDPVTGELLIPQKDIPKTLEELNQKVFMSDDSGVLYTSSRYGGKVHSPAYLFTSRDGKKIYVLEGSAIGYGGSVVCVAAFVKEEDGFKLNALRVTSYSQETPGLGAKIGEKEVMERFYPVPPEALEKGLKVNKDAGVVPVEDPEKMKYLREHEGVIQTSDIMTGATLTPRAVVNTINTMYEFLRGEVNE
ncbi:MAG: H+/Na+-translocating ferredoxin:NAD+ oxidoreductase subunit [Thermotogota bacterium]|nr:H+/Na+-translocating ferredoxin:NAD+ oxidoreductase subunit [Thermotogota bacterium]MDK2864078.1 H+/Na+-translocating ferredoxin:NAD+ oxidoreductase subunit [Thermotogota bacterium]HCZ06130.1 electron transporter RnfG [Thermotogota bacterium]